MVARLNVALIIGFAPFALFSCAAAPMARGDGEHSHAAQANRGSELVHDPYEVPSSSVAELLAFIKKVQALRGTVPREEYETRAFSALKLAAEKVREIAKDDDRKLPGFDDAVAIALYFRV